MENNLCKAKIVLVTGMIGIIGTLLTIASDIILLGRPYSAFWFFKLGTENMAFLTEWRITTGTFLGVIVLPFQLAGLIPLFYGLRPAGTRLSLIAVITAGDALIMGVAFHASYAFIASGWKLLHAVNSEKVSEMMWKFNSYWMIIIITMFTQLLICTICYLVSILSQKTLFPKWMALLSPLCIFIFLFPVIYIIPAPVGGFVAPGYLNLSTMIFFILSTCIVYKKIKSLA